jgi:plasmid stabilization system protein ParE
MKGLPVFSTALAEEDLDQIEDYISARDPAAAARVGLQSSNKASKSATCRKRE